MGCNFIHNFTYYFYYIAQLKLHKTKAVEKVNIANYHKNLIFCFSLPVGHIDIVAFAVCLDCGNVSKKINDQLDLNFLPTQDFVYCTQYTINALYV